MGGWGCNALYIDGFGHKGAGFHPYGFALVGFVVATQTEKLFTKIRIVQGSIFPN